MALVTKITKQTLANHVSHREVECTYDIITDIEGNKYLQLDTYGSKERQIPGKKSQSIRIAPAALAQLKQILESNGL